MKKITGRPKKAVRLEKQVKFFVTSVDYFIIQHKAESAGLSIPEFMRQLSIKGQVKPRWTPEERDIFKSLVRMANDIHEVREIARKEGILSSMLYFEKYRDNIDYAIERLGKG